jgi:ribosome-binding protein aMBF1 (putative translation factor)
MPKSLLSMITGLQIRAARAALGWSAKQLAHQSDVGLRTVLRAESSDEVPAGHTLTISKLEKTLKNAGIEFIGSAENGPGVRLWKKETLKQL